MDASRYAAGTLTLPSRPSEERLERLLAFGASHRRPVLVAVDDESVLFVEDHADALDSAFLFPHQPDRLASSLTDKRTMYELCQREGLATPRSAFPRLESELAEHARESAFPIVLKRLRPSLGKARPKVSVVRDREQLLAAYRLMASSEAIEPEVMIQEYIPHTHQPDWLFNGYFDARSRCTAAFTGRKLRQAPPEGGSATMGVCVANEAVEESSRSFLEALGYRGLVDIDYRFDGRDGQYKVLDVNARIGASFRLFVSGDGTDVLRVMYADITGAPLEAAAQPEGRRWLVEPQDLRFARAHLREDSLTLGAWARSLREVDECAWWARDDPRPALALLIWLLGERARKLSKTRGRRSPVARGLGR